MCFVCLYFAVLLSDVTFTEHLLSYCNSVGLLVRFLYFYICVFTSLVVLSYVLFN